MVDGGEELDDGEMYCFRCTDSVGGGDPVDVWVDIDILWHDFRAKLERRFGRPVYLMYKRDGEQSVRSVQVPNPLALLTCTLCPMLTWCAVPSERRPVRGHVRVYG